jgi:hypothetical protein
MSPPRLEVCLTVDIEFDINGALTFPERHRPCGADAVVRPTGTGSTGLDALLEPLVRHGLPITAFVETLQCHHFGLGEMAGVVDRLRATSLVDLQLHLHPCWREFRHPDWPARVKTTPRNDDMARRGAQARTIIDEATGFFRELTGTAPLALRTGGLSVDRDVCRAQLAAGIPLASSVGRAYAPSPDPELRAYAGLLRCEGVTEAPVTSFRARGPRGPYDKLLTVAGNALGQIEQVLQWHRHTGTGPVVLLTHTSELAPVRGLRSPPLFDADRRVQRRWAALCEYLARRDDQFEVVSFAGAWPRWQQRASAVAAPLQGGFAVPLRQLLARAGWVR